MALQRAEIEQTIKCCVSEDVLSTHRASALLRGLPYLRDREDRQDALGVVGGGDSAVEALGHRGPLMAINGAYDWLREHGRVAKWFLATDPQPEMVDFVGGILPETECLVADFADPALFDALEARGARVTLLRMIHPGYDCPKGLEIPGGMSAMTRAPVVACYLGFRGSGIRLYGADCCTTDRQHVYDPENDYQERRGNIYIMGRKFKTTPQYFAQARYLSEMIPALAELNITIAGDNLATTMLAWADAQKVKLHEKLRQEHGDICGV